MFDPFTQQSNPWTLGAYGATPQHGFSGYPGNIGTPFASPYGVSPFGMQGGFQSQLAPQTWLGNPWLGGGQNWLGTPTTQFGHTSPYSSLAIQQIPHLVHQAQQIAQQVPQLAQQIPQLIQQNPQLATQAPQLQMIPHLLQQAANLAQQVPNLLQQVYSSNPFTQNPYTVFGQGGFGRQFGVGGYGSYPFA